MATFAYLLLDSSYDPVFDPTAQLTNADAVGQAILTNLKLFLGEWWENLNLGLPVLQSMLGQLAVAGTLNAASLAIQQQVEATPYVTDCTGVTVGVSAAGQLQFTCVAQTSFGPVTVSNLPAASASIVSTS